MAKIKTIARIKPCPEPYDDFECTRNKLYIRIPEHCGRDSTLYNKTRAPIVNHEFKFNHVLDAAATQDEVFDVTAKGIISGFLDGYNGTIFAYGQTGSGKTHTMEGSTLAPAAATVVADGSQEKGIVPRALASIFAALKARTDDSEKVTLHVSYLEIYQEVGYDLLHVLDRSTPGVPTLPKVTVVEGPNSSTVLRNLSIHLVSSEQDAQTLLVRGQVNRKVAETPMNQRSSRSHAIFTVYLAVRRGDVITKSKLHFVDLAGSERVCRTGVQGLQLAEAKYINLSLHHLEGVIIALHQDSIALQRAAALTGTGNTSAALGSRSVPPSTPMSNLSRSWAGRSAGRPYTADSPTKHHIPYRNSLLTMVLKDSLGGNCLTTMIATISVSEDNLSETISTCRFSQRVASILNAAKKNEEIDDKSMIKRLRKRVAELEAENTALKYGSTGAVPENSDGLTDEEKTACAEIVQNFLRGQIVDPVTAGITDPNKFRECMKVFRSLVVDTMRTVTPMHATAARTQRSGYHQDAPISGVTNRISATQMTFRDDSHSLLRNYAYLRPQQDRATAQPTRTALDASRSYLNGSGPIGRLMTGQSVTAWASALPRSSGAAAASGGNASTAGSNAIGGSAVKAGTGSGILAQASPYEAKQVKEAMKLNRKVTEGLAQQTLEQEHLKAFRSSVLEQELELAERDLERRVQIGSEQVARQQAYLLKLRQDGADAALTEQEELVERHLISRQAKLSAQLSAARERLQEFRSGASTIAPSAAEGGAPQAAAMDRFAPTVPSGGAASAASTSAAMRTYVGGGGSPAADSGLGGGGLSAEDKLRMYVKSNGKINAKAVLTAMQEQDKLQKQIQDKIDRQRVLVLSHQLEVKETATRQRLLELKARLAAAASSGGSGLGNGSVGGSGEASQHDGEERDGIDDRVGGGSGRGNAVDDGRTLAPATITIAASRPAASALFDASGSSSASAVPSAAAIASARGLEQDHHVGAATVHADAATGQSIQRQIHSQQQQQPPMRNVAVHSQTPVRAPTYSAAASSAAAGVALGGSRSGTTAGAIVSRTPGDAAAQQLQRIRSTMVDALASAAATRAESRAPLPQAGGNVVWSAAGGVASTSGVDSKRRQIEEVVEKYRTLRLALKQKKDEVLIRTAAASAAAARASAAAAAASVSTEPSVERSSAAGRRQAPSPVSMRVAADSSNGGGAGRRGRSRPGDAVRDGSRSRGGGDRNSRSGGGGSSAPRRQLMVTMAKYKRDRSTQAARQRVQPAARGTRGNVDASEGSGRDGAYLMQQMMAAAAIESAASAARAPASQLLSYTTALGTGGGGAGAGEMPSNARLRLVLSKEVMRKLVLQ